MLFTVKDDLDLCVELKLTPAQLMFVKMLVPDMSKEESERRKAGYAMAIKYQKQLGGISPDELSDLLARDIIIDHNDHGKSFYEYYEINPDFNYKFRLQIYPMVQELHDAYPNFFQNGAGKEFVAKSCTLEEIALDYLRAINKDPEEHKKVIKDIEWARQNGAIVLGLKKFVGAKYWNAIRELKKKTGTSKNSADVTII